MNYWLIKSEPGTWSWDDHVRVGIEPWDGVRNYQACNNMKAMKIGDKAFFYHSVKEKRIMGVVEVAKEYHPDPSDASGRFGMVAFKALYPVANNLTLGEIKADERLQDLSLVKQSRLSVMPIDAKSWKIMSDLCGVDP